MQEVSNAGVQNTQDKGVSLRDLFSIRWYIEQTKGWNPISYWLIIIAAIGNIYISFFMGHPVTWVTYVTYIASILSIWTIGGITNSRPVNGVGGILSAVLYIIAALVAKNPADAILQGFYILVLDLPVLTMPAWSKDVEKKIRFIHETDIRGEKHGKKFWYPVLAIVGVGLFVLAYWFETQVLHTPRPISDSLVLGSGAVGAILTTFRFGEAFGFWLIQGVLQVILWGYTAMSGDANWVLFFTYMLFLVNDLVGVFASKWFHHAEETKEIVSQNESEKVAQ